MTAGIQSIAVAVIVGGAVLYLVRDAVIRFIALKRASERGVAGCGTCCDCPKPTPFSEKNCVLKEKVNLRK